MTTTTLPNLQTTPTTTAAPITTDPIAQLQALEKERQHRIQTARQKRIVPKATLVARKHGKIIYHNGYTLKIATFPHPTNPEDVVEIWHREKTKYIPTAGEAQAITIDIITVWVHRQGDRHPTDPFLSGETWVRVLNLEEAPPEARVKEQDYWTYIPGAWEEAISAKAAEIAAEIAEKRRAQARARLDELTRLLMPPRPV